MPRTRTATAHRPEVDTDLDIEADFLSDEDYFLDELRNAVARAKSSSAGGFDLREGRQRGGFDWLQAELGD